VAPARKVIQNQNSGVAENLSKDARRRMGELFVPAPQAPMRPKLETTDIRAARSQRRRRIR
jgi:hypothetical protein